MVVGSDMAALRSRCETLIWRTACDLDEVAFASVGDCVLAALPVINISMTSCT